MLTQDGAQALQLGASIPLCPLDPKGESDHICCPWLVKLEPKANSLTLENHPRERREGAWVAGGGGGGVGGDMTSTSHQVSLLCLVLGGEANLHKWKRLLGDFQALCPFLSSFSGIFLGNGKDRAIPTDREQMAGRG